MLREARIAEVYVDLIEATQVVHRHLTSSMCESVFCKLRTRERARTWTLELMARFWVSVVMGAPDSLREALEEAHGGRGGFPLVESAPSSFFERAQGMRWEFFQELFERFVESALPECPPDFERELRALLPSFAEIWIVDGSGLDRVARKLKILRRVREVVIPGSVTALYDLFRGVPRALLFHEQLLGGESRRLLEAVDKVPKGTLLVADRGFSSVRLLSVLAERGVHALIRLKRNVVAKDVEELARHRDDGADVTERLAVIGTGQGAPRMRVRLIEKRLPGGEVLRLVTTVLDPAELSAAAALALYRRRWAVERLFQDLKEVLDLRRFYAANTNAVAMQVYASAIVYAALRVAQAHIARKHERRPEELSTAKLFPRVAAAHHRLVEAIKIFEETRRVNPRVDLIEPDWAAMGLYRARLKRLLVHKRSGPRRKPKYSKRRMLMVSLQRYERRRRPRGRDP